MEPIAGHINTKRNGKHANQVCQIDRARQGFQNRQADQIRRNVQIINQGEQKCHAGHSMEIAQKQEADKKSNAIGPVNKDDREGEKENHEIRQANKRSNAVEPIHEAENGKEKSKTQKAMELFSERVSITGLEQAYKATIRIEKLMWLVSYILCCIGIGFTVHGLVLKYTNETVVYDDFPIFNQRAPFPNVTICGPEANNRTKLRDMLVITEDTMIAIKKKNLSLDGILNLTLDTWHTNFKYLAIKQNVSYRIAFQIIDDTAPGNLTATLAETIPPCEKVLSNCTYDGIPFDCCQSSHWIFFDELVCYQISVSLLNAQYQCAII